MKNSKLNILLRALLFSGMMLFVVLWIFSKSDQKPPKSPNIETAYFQAQLEEVEKRLLEQYQEEADQSLTIHVYDIEGNLLSTKTYPETDQIVNVERLFITNSEYITTIYNDVYVIRDL